MRWKPMPTYEYNRLTELQSERCCFTVGFAARTQGRPDHRLSGAAKSSAMKFIYFISCFRLSSMTPLYLVPELYGPTPHNGIGAFHSGLSRTPHVTKPPRISRVCNNSQSLRPRRLPVNFAKFNPATGKISRRDHSFR